MLTSIALILPLVSFREGEQRGIGGLPQQGDDIDGLFALP